MRPTKPLPPRSRACVILWICKRRIVGSCSAAILFVVLRGKGEANRSIQAEVHVAIKQLYRRVLNVCKNVPSCHLDDQREERSPTLKIAQTGEISHVRSR